jgi:murein DD-endopeptidase MepM/ murein hydrolase activator NlpD
MRHIYFSRVALRLALAAGAAATISGCSDASRFASDPFSDPLGSQMKVASHSGRPIDNVSTGSISGPNTPGAVQSQPLAPPNASASVASAAGGNDRWSAQGGTPVTLADGETPEMVANRYGVPADVLVRVNGFSSASEVTPGSRLVIPVYRNKVAEAPKPAAAPHQVAEAPKPAVSAPAKVAALPAKIAPAAPSKPLTPAQARVAAMAQAKAAAAAAKPAVAAAKPQPAAAAKPQALAQKAPAPAAQTAHAGKAAAPAVVANAAPAPAPAPAAPPPAAAPKAPSPVAQAEMKEEAQATDKVGSGAHPEFRWPARGRVIQNFASGGNDGINIALPEGTQVKAAEAGVVAYAGNGLKGYGNLVLIKHPNGFVSAYAHNGEIAVKAGDQVTRGQTIAKSGQSGDVPTPQLHFELRKGKTPVDPMGYLASL